MIKYNIENITVTEKKKTIETVKCDICGTEYEYKDNQNNVFEIQEFLHIRREGGYGSVFGDTQEIECDICQDCLYKFIEGKYREVN